MCSSGDGSLCTRTNRKGHFLQKIVLHCTFGVENSVKRREFVDKYWLGVGILTGLENGARVDRNLSAEGGMRGWVVAVFFFL